MKKTFLFKTVFAWQSCTRLMFLVALAFPLGKLSASTVYWDQNTSTAGFQTTASSGNWTTSAFWTTDTAGSTGPWSTAVSNDDFVFASGVANSNNASITLSTSFSVNSITLRNGRWAFIGTGSPVLTIGSGGLTWNVPLTGTASGNTTFANSLSMILNGSQTWTNNANVATNQIVVSGGVVGNAVSGSNTLTLTGSAGGSGIQFGGVIGNGSGGGNLALTVNNSLAAATATDSTYQITGVANTYSGKTAVQSGTLRIASLANAGASSSLGNATSANSVIDLGSGTNTAGLILNGSAASSSDRVINLAGTTGGGVIKNFSTAATSTLTLTSAITNAGGGNKTLTLGGTNTGNNTISGSIGDAVDLSKTALNKVDAGTWILSGSNSFTGGLTLSAGILTLNSAGTFDGGININGGTLNVNAAGALGLNASTNLITINGGNLLLGATATVGSLQTISIGAGGGGIGIAADPVSFGGAGSVAPGVTPVFGFNYTGTGGGVGGNIGSVTNIQTLFTTGGWALGAFTGFTGDYTGNLLYAETATSNYRLGGGGGSLTIENTGNNILTGANNLVIGATTGGTIILKGSNDYTGTTTLNNGTLTFASGATLGNAVSAINIGSGTNAVVFNYNGSGETIGRALNFTGTTGGIILGNSGTGDVVYSGTPTFTGVGARTIQLGNASDSKGGSIGNLTDQGANKTSISKQGLSNSTWALTGTNTYTGNTAVTGGVLQTASATSLAGSYVTLNGVSTTQNAVWQTQGTITRVLSGTASGSNISLGGNAGFAAKGGSLTVNLGSGTNLVWVTNFGGAGGASLVFGSTTADNQVIFQNNVDFGAATLGFNRQILVEKGLGGDSAVMTGILSSSDVGSVGNNGLVKTGGGTLILSGNNTYSGATIVSAGTLVAANNVSATVGVAGAFGDGHVTGVNAGTTTVTLGDGSTTTNNSAVALMIGNTANDAAANSAAYTVARAVTIANQATTGGYTIGGSTDSNATFSGLITANQSFKVTQVATTGANALNITGGITGAAAGTKTVTFDNAGKVNVTGNITNGAGTVAVVKTNSGVTVLSGTNTYTGATTVGGGTLLVNGTLVAGSSFTVNSATLGGSGTVSGLVTTTGLGSRISPGNSPGTLSLAGGLDASLGATFDFELGTSSDLLSLGAGVMTGSSASGGLVFNFSDSGGLTAGTAYTLLTYGSSTGLDYTDFVANVLAAGFSLDNSFGTNGFQINATSLQVQFAAVPEPSTYALIAMGLGSLWVLRRKKKA